METKDPPEAKDSTWAGAMKARGKSALSKAKDSMDTLYGKKLTDRVEEYAHLSYHVLAAHEDRLVLTDKALQGLDGALAANANRVTSLEKRVDRLGPPKHASQRIAGLPLMWRVLILLSLAAGTASLVIQLV